MHSTKLVILGRDGILNEYREGHVTAPEEWHPVPGALEAVARINHAGWHTVVATNQSLGAAAGSFSGYFDLMKEDPARQKKIADIGNARFAPALKKLGLAQKTTEETVDSNLRSTLIGSLGSMNNAEVQAEAKRLFAELDKNPAALDGPLRTTWLGLIAYNADKPTWDKIRKLGQSAESNAVKSTMYRLLGESKDKTLAADALKLAPRHFKSDAAHDQYRHRERPGSCVG